MTARSHNPESRRSSVCVTVALVLTILAVLLVAGCFRPNNLCGGKFEIYELADYLKPGDNVVHLTEQDFRDNPDLAAVIRGVKRSNATCDNQGHMYGPCIGGSGYECGGEVRLHKYLTMNDTVSFKDQKFLEYDGKFYFMRITMVA